MSKPNIPNPLDSARGYTVFFQPIVDCNGRTVKFEVLLRTLFSTQMPVPQLIAFAEKTGTVQKLDLWSFGQALKLLPAIHKINPEVGISANLSPKSLTSELPQLVEQLLVQAGVNPMKAVKQFGIEYIQGFFFAKPMSGDKFLEYLAAKKYQAA